MRPIQTDKSVTCRVFRQLVYHLQANELAEVDRDRLLDHVDDCPGCARYLEVEDSFLAALRGRLRAEPAPGELGRRVRDALDRESATPARTERWYRTPAASALAAAVLLFALLVVPLGRRASDPGAGARALHATRTATVVDHDCDAAGRTLAEQKGCEHRRHLNVLKVGGAYWHVNLDRPEARDLVFGRDQRGRKIVVEADFYPDLQTLRLTRVREAATGPL